MSHVPESELQHAPAVVVLNWQQYEATRECLESLLRMRRPARLYLVDNASSTDGRESLKRQFPTLTVLPLEQNQGFAPAMNQGIALALKDGASHVLLFNNDARATPALLDQLLAMYGAQKDVGIVGPSLRELPPSTRVQAVGIDVNLFTGRVRLRHPGVEPEALYPYPHKVDAVPGTAMMVSRKVFDAVGLLVPDYFFYYEDIDLCLRARGVQLYTYVAPNAIAYHQGGLTMGDAPEKAYYAVRNQLHLVKEHAVKLPWPLRVARSGFVTGLNVAQVLGEGKIPPVAGLTALARGIQDHLAGRGGAFGRSTPLS